VLGHTLNGTLKLAEDERGLHQWTRVAPTSYAEDLLVLLDRKDIQQASFCFTIAAERWECVDEGKPTEEIKVTITEVGTLYDVTVCALGAYPQTNVSIEMASRSRLDAALREGRVGGLPTAAARRLTEGGEIRRRRTSVAWQRKQQAERRRDLERARRDMGRTEGKAAHRQVAVTAPARVPVSFGGSGRLDGGFYGGAL
jgi:HK97 family phage prohead protease